MKIIKYKVLGYTSVFDHETEEVERKECFAEFVRDYSEANEEIAKKEAYNGEYTIEDDGQPDSVVEPSTDEIINAMLGVM